MKPGAYLICGEEPYLIRKKVKELISTVEMPQLNVSTYDELSENVTAACRQLPFASDKRIIIVDSAKLFKQAPEPLLDYMKSPSPGNYLICVTGNPDRKTKIYKGFEKQGKEYVLLFNKLKANALSSFVREECSKKGLIIANEEINFLINRIGYEQSDKTLFDVVSSIDIFSNTGSQIVTRELIERYIEESIDQNVFTLTNLISKKDMPNAFKHLEGLLTSGEPPLKLIGLIERHYRLAYKKVLMKHEGTKVDIGVNSYVLDQVNTSGMTPVAAMKAMELCQYASNSIKTGELSANMSIELLLAQLITLM